MDLKYEASLFSKVWAALYNPRSGAPDVSLSAMRRVLTRVLADEMTDLSRVERWIVAYVSISPASESMIELSWSEETVPNRYELPLDELSILDRRAIDEAKTALEGLVKMGRLTVHEQLYGLAW